MAWTRASTAPRTTITSSTGIVQLARSAGLRTVRTGFASAQLKPSQAVIRSAVGSHDQLMPVLALLRAGMRHQHALRDDSLADARSCSTSAGEGQLGVVVGRRVEPGVEPGRDRGPAQRLAQRVAQ